MLNRHVLINGQDFTCFGALFLAYADLVCSKLSSRGVGGPHIFPTPGCIRLSESAVRNSKEVILVSALDNVYCLKNDLNSGLLHELYKLGQQHPAFVPAEKYF